MKDVVLLTEAVRILEEAPRRRRCVCEEERSFLFRQWNISFPALAVGHV